MIKKSILIVILFLVSYYSFCDDVLNRVSNYIAKLDYTSAIDELESAIKSEPYNTTYYYTIINLSLDIEDLSMAEMYLNKLKKYYKEDANIKIYEMEILRLKGNLSEAFSISKNLLKLSWIKTNEIFIAFYSKLLSEDDTQKAIDFILPYAQIYKENYKIFTTLASFYLKKNDLKNTKLFLDKAISINRFNKDIYLLYGEYYYRKGDFNNTINSLEKFILFPGSKNRSYYILAESFYKIGDYKKSLEYSKLLNLGEEALAKTMYDSKDYESLVKTYRNSENGIVNFFVEESLMKISPYSISDLRKELSKKNYSKAINLKRRGIPYYEFFLRRAIRLDPYNYSAWYELANYYKYFLSPYYSLEELKLGNSIFVNNYQLQDYISSLSKYISNYSKLTSWKINTSTPENFKFLVKIYDINNISISNYFVRDALKYAIDSWKFPNIKFYIIEGEISKSKYKNYDLVIEVHPEIFKNYLNVKFSVISPKDYDNLTNFTISEKINGDILPNLYYDSRYQLNKVLPTFGKVIGFNERFCVIRIFNGLPTKDKEVTITDSTLDEVFRKKNNTYATGKIVDSEGEYALVELGDKYKFLTELKKNIIVFIP